MTPCVIVVAARSRMRTITPQAKPKPEGVAKPKPGCKTSRSPQKKPQVKREVRHELEDSDDGIERMETDPAPGLRYASGSGSEEEEEDVRQRLAAASLQQDRTPKPYPVTFSGAIPKSIEDIDTKENIHQRRHCARLFNGEVEFKKDQDGLQECMLFQFPERLPLDKRMVFAWKEAEQKRIREGKPEVDFNEWVQQYDEGLTDDERQKTVECCSPADLEGMQVGEIRIYEDGYVEWVCGGVRFEVTEGTKVVDRQDVYVADMECPNVDAKGRECDITIYPMMTVRHRVVVAPVIDDLL